MPLKRSPPPRSSASEMRTSAANSGYATASPVDASQAETFKQQEYRSSVNMINRTSDNLQNVTVRDKKKKCEESSPNELREFMNDMREMFESFKSGIESNLHDLQVYVGRIKSQNTEITNSIQFMSDKIDEFVRKIDKLEGENLDNRKYIGLLEDKIEYLERKSRSSSIELRNIPRRKDETKQDLCDILINLGNTLNLKIDKTEIKDIHRTTTSKEQDKPIVVDLCSTLKKDDLILSLKKFNRNKRNEDKLNTEHIKIAGQKKPIFISEVLSYKMKRIYYLAREFAKEKKYNYCWTSRGIVYLREKENAPFVRIVNESVLTELRNKA